MPLVRYFLYAGGALLALIFLVDWYWPATPATAVGNDRAERTSLDKEILRIQSAQLWPQKIVFDTNLPAVVPPQPTAATVAPPTPALAATPVAGKPELNAFAELKPVVPVQNAPRKAVRHKASKAATARVAAYPVTPSWSWNW